MKSLFPTISLDMHLCDSSPSKEKAVTAVGRRFALSGGFSMLMRSTSYSLALNIWGGRVGP